MRLTRHHEELCNLDAVNKELAGDLSASAAAKQNLESGILEMWRGHPKTV